MSKYHLICSLLGLLLLSAQIPAAILLQLSDDTEMSVQDFPARDGDNRLLLWIHGEFGHSTREPPIQKELAARGIEVWSIDLHSTWFLAPGRNSLNQVDPALMADVIAQALDTGKQVYILSNGRLVSLILQAIRNYQLGDAPTDRLGGLISLSPRLYVRTPEGGEDAEFLPIARAANLPVYLLQPRLASGIWRIGEVADTLSQGGSPVFVQTLEGVSDGFHTRENFTPEEQAMTRRLPGLLISAMGQLAAYAGTPEQAAPLTGPGIAPETPRDTELLRPYAAGDAVPALRLPSLEGGIVDLGNLRGKVVMVNFWATWCPPCVVEIPSLQRLYRARQEQGLEILAVDVGETRETVQTFMQQQLADSPIDFRVLLDTDGTVLRRWKVHAFPTTLVLDRNHRIRYAVFGAFDWDSKEVHRKLEPLLRAGAGAETNLPGRVDPQFGRQGIQFSPQNPR